MLAHYIIAAKSALNSHQGFLNSRANPVLDRQGDAPDSVTEFETSVNESHLNSRAWVFQERILSSRIIHFTDQETYWECGEFVRCNDWTSLECTPGRDYFAQDPAFPMRLHRAGVARATDFLQFVFAGYSRRGITVLTDRKKAISEIPTLMQ
ncbi:hypothetical protein H9L39_15693 [Fusarium oxysporum f. sp. albedinis]|nr:hypothetical protein H9L39_15693 [Fusarium oxysporum f. sp. albedinis]